LTDEPNLCDGYPTTPPDAADHPTRGRPLNKTESKLTNSLVGGGHEGGSGSNEEGEEEEGTHLGKVVLFWGVG